MIYQQLANVENEHWWHQSRRQLVNQILNPIKLSPNAQILDVGCGTGGTTRFLSRYGSVTGVDVAEVLVYVQEQASSVKFMEGDANHLINTFPSESFDLITFFGVLCHEYIDSDVDVLQQAMQLLKPGGYILITEAAYRFLRRQHDIQAKAKRRYRITDFRQYFNQTGLTYQTGRYFNAISFPICLVLAAINRIIPHHDQPSQEIAELKIPPAWLNATMKKIMDIERTLYSWIPLPIGVSFLVLGRKP